MDDTLAFYGGAVKALGGGKIEGYGVLYTAAHEPDLQEEQFTKGTNLMIDPGETRPLLYRHGSNKYIKSQVGGKAVLDHLDDAGAFFTAELDTSDKYWNMVYKLAERGKAYFSTGSMPHLVSKELVKTPTGTVNELKCWPVSELSITPCPVEPRARAFAVKDLLMDDDVDFEEMVKSFNQEEFDEQFSIEGIPSIKAFCEAVAPNSLKDGSHRSESAANAAKEFITITKILGEAYDSYASRLVKRTESRFLKQGREIDPSTVKQVESTLADMDKVHSAFQAVKESLSGIKKIADMSVSEQRAMNERARAEMWNFYRISGLTPEESDNGTSSTG